MNLKISEDEMLENLNRRENIRIVGIPGNVSREYRVEGESCEETLQKVVELAKHAGAEVDAKYFYRSSVAWTERDPDSLLSGFQGECHDCISRRIIKIMTKP